MRLHHARLENFRNIESAEVHFSPHFTAVVGPNGQGKTNFLEALYWVAGLRSLRNVPRRALIRHGAEAARIQVTLERADTGLTHTLSVELRGTTRTLKKDEQATEASRFIGTFVAVAFTPDDLSLGKGSPDGRRKFLDRALLNIKPSYLKRALRYQKGVKDRNRVLADDGSDEILEAFDEVVATEGAAVTVARAQYTDQITGMIARHFSNIAAPAPTLGVHYESSLKDALIKDSEVQTKEAFLARLKARRAHDRRRRTTSTGPHLDDLVLTFDGTPIKERASQGQHRAIALALKMAELSHLSQQLGEPPVLLLDDMSSELDQQRSGQLFEAVERLEGQIVVSSTEVPKLVADIYDVNAGALTKL